MNNLAKFLFCFPLASSIINLQNLLRTFIGLSDSAIQIFAYFNFVAVLVGSVLTIHKKTTFPPLVRLWFLFFTLYYSFALIANVYLNTEPYKLFPSLIPVAYFFAAATFLSIKPKSKIFANTLLYSFLTATVLLIVFFKLGISLDAEDGFSLYEINRAGGVYGDANNAAVSAILTFALFKYLFKPKTKFGKLIKILILLLAAYAISLTFSRTGMVVFILVLIISYHKLLFTRKAFATLLLLPVAIFLLYSFMSTQNKLTPVQEARIESTIAILTLQSDKINYSSRDVLLERLINFIEENPLGNGVQFSTEIRAHNTVMGVWGDAGIITFIVFLALIMFYWLEVLKASGGNKYLAACILATLCIFMLSLQSIINQSYLMVVFVFVTYLLKDNTDQPVLDRDDHLQIE